MSHYRMQDDMPSAIILAKNPRTSSLDELKSYNENTIYLNNGNEFSIRLFNPTTSKIGVQIDLNGSVSKSYLVLNPGEDVTLNRFIDDNRKMVFETYTYDSSNPSAEKAIVNNGNITVSFFNEKNNYYNNIRVFNGYQSLISGSTSSTGGYINCNHTFTNTSFNNNCTLTSGTLNLKDSSIGGSSLNDIKYDGLNDGQLSFSSDISSKPNIKSFAPKETGRVEKGEKSDQHFKNVEVQFESKSFHKVEYKIKPVSEKREDYREYCTECGFRLKNDKFNFCPKCGTKI